MHETFVEAIHREHGQQLERFFIARVRTVADARDLAQELYLRLIRLRRETVLQVEDPRRYVYTAAINLCREFKIKKREEAAGRLRWQGEQAVHTDWEISSVDFMQNNRLRRALEELRPKCRAVIILHRAYGWKYDEIARRLGISSSMVKKYLRIGTGRLRALMQADVSAEDEPTADTSQPGTPKGRKISGSCSKTRLTTDPTEDNTD